MSEEKKEELWEKVKRTVHISHSKLDDEIKSKVVSCKLDLKRVGINDALEDELISVLCELYTKWHLNFNGMGAEFQKSYEEMRDAVSLSEDYKLKMESCTGATGGDVDDTIE